MGLERTTGGSSAKVSVLLVNPPLPHNRRLKRIFPLGLLYLASYLRRQSRDGVAVEIFNPQVTNTGFRETLKTILSREWQILGFGYWTSQFQFVSRMSAAVKSARPNGVVVHGGVHPTLRPEAAASSADWVFLQEGEHALAEFVDQFVNGGIPSNVPGTARLERGEIRINPPLGFIKDLDDLPFPAWDLIDLKRYTTPMHVIGGQRFPIIGSRGCPYNCSFCVSPTLWKRRVRWRSPENIVDEMGHLKSRFNVDCFHFWDDNLLLNRKHIVRVAEEILRRNLKVKWVGLSNASHVVHNETIMPLLAKAGLLGLEIGIESANPESYRIVEKNETLENLVTACEIQKKNGMFPMYTYMAYMPGDTIRGTHDQARFMDRLLSGIPRYRYFHHLPFDIYIGQCCTPHVGSRMYEQVESLGRPMWESEEDFHHSASCFLPHSFLHDRPVRRASHLSIDDRVFCVIVAYVAIADYLSYDGPLRKMHNVAVFNRLLDDYWKECDGKLSLLEIAEKIAQRGSTGLDLNDILKFLAAASVTLAQVGVLDSADTSCRAPMTRKDVPYRFKHVYRMLLQLSRLYGRVTGSDTFRINKHYSYDT